MQYRDFEFYLSEKDNVFQHNWETGKDERFTGLCCEIYRAIDGDTMKNPLCVFDLAADVDVPGLDENAAIQIVKDRIDKEYDLLMEEAALSMDRFIKINGAVFSFEEVAQALGVECDPAREPVQLHLCQRVDDGVLVAKGAFFDKDDYPAIDLELQLPSEKDSLPVMISRTEQPRVKGAYSDGYQGVRTFGYSRADEYFMYFDSDTRPDAVVDKDYNQKGLNPKIVVSGGYNYTPEVYQENRYVKFMGELSIEEQVKASDIKLEVGMVGRLKDEDGIKKTLRGRPFVVAAVGDDGFASCKISIGGKEQTFMVHASQIDEVGMPSPALGDLFSTKKVDGHVLAGLDRTELKKALEDAPIGTIITGVRDAPGSYGYGKYDFDTRIEKQGGHVQNYFAPVKTVNYETWWTVDGAKKNVFELADILQGKSKYYSLTEQKDDFSMDEKDNGVRDLAGRLVDFMKEFDFYHFQDTLGPGGEEDALAETVRDLEFHGGAFSYVEALSEILNEGELTEAQEAEARALIEELNKLGDNMDLGSLEVKISSAREKMSKTSDASAHDKSKLDMEL